MGNILHKKADFDIIYAWICVPERFFGRGLIMDISYIGAEMNSENSIANQNLTYEDIAYTVADHIVKSRKTAVAKWNPYTRHDAIRYKDERDLIFDAKRFYPEAEVGDCVYTACNIMVEADCELWIHVCGAVKVFYNGECLFSSYTKAMNLQKTKQYKTFSVRIKAHEMPHLVIKTVCTGENFGFKLSLSAPGCFGMWPNYYLN